MNTTKGFVTLAVGHERYYKLAANLLKSYRLRVREHYPFAIFADRHNKYTALFDKVIIIDQPSFSYNDKLELLNNPPFHYNIFIDADCLVYENINSYWDYYTGVREHQAGVRCFGKSLPISSRDGWFNIEDIGEYKDLIYFIPQMHGGIIFFTNDTYTQRIYQQAKDIAKNYSKYKFKYFDKPADEPILALCMAINNIHPIELNATLSSLAYIFYPTAKDIRIKGKVDYSIDGKNWVSNVKLLHWQNIYTLSDVYWAEIKRLEGHSEFYISVLQPFIRAYLLLQSLTKRIINKFKHIC